jgi:hypothetical protein
MTDFETKIISKIKHILRHGWGELRIVISANGQRKTFYETLTEIDEPKKRLDKR